MNEAYERFDSPISVLIIDDEESIRVSLKFHFDDFGFRTRTVSSGEEALEIMEDELPDAVIVDLRLPGIDGIDFIRQASSKWSGLHFIIYTGSPATNLPEDIMSTEGVSEKLFFKPLEDLSLLSNEVIRLADRD